MSDVLIATVALVVLAAPMGLVALAIYLESGHPVAFRQRRIGRGGSEYLMWKFRSLPPGTPQLSKEALLRTGMRPTALGAFLRRYSLDELPQLINVLAGDMSVVGPRPALFSQTDLTEMRRRAGVLRIRPGLTGLAQVSGREDLSLDEKVSLDAEYASRVSPLSDLRILVMTLRAVIKGRGSY